MKITNKILLTVVSIMFLLVLILVVVSRIIIERESWVDDFNEFNSDIVENEYNISDFSSVKIAGLRDVSIQSGDEYRIIINSSDSLSESVDVRKNGDTLAIEYSDYRQERVGSVRAEITMPDISYLDLTKGARVFLNDFNTDELKASILDACRLIGDENTIGNLYLRCTGDSQVKLRRSSTVNADLDVSGDSKVIMKMSGGDLTGKVTGDATIVYYGEVRSDRLEFSGNVTIRIR